MSITVDPVAQLPVDHLSVSSLKLFMDCPIKWMRRHLLKEYEPPSGAMIAGSAAGAAVSQHYGAVIETGEGLSTEQVLDEFDAEWTERVEREEVDWGEERPGVLKDQSALAVDAYHRHIAPLVVPVSVEREFRLWWPGVDWDVVGFLDLEDAEGRVGDLKLKGRRLSRSEAEVDLQPGTYLAARRAEGQPAESFEYHTMIRAKKPTAEVVPTRRTDAQLDAVIDRFFLAANEIAWRAETETWSGAAPGSWRCSERWCGFWAGCQFGGAR